MRSKEVCKHRGYRRYAMLFEKGHQSFSSCISANAVKVKGAVSTEFLPDEVFHPALEGSPWYRKVWDAEDIVVPPHVSPALPNASLVLLGKY